MKSKLICALAAAVLALTLFPAVAQGEADGVVFTLLDEQGNALTSRYGTMYLDDEYISGDNQLYRVVRVDEAAGVAVAAHVGEEPSPDRQTVAAMAEALAAETKKIAIYCTHSDESYEKGDGDSSKLEGAGIYDVANTFAEALRKRGFEVEVNETSHLPHDTQAYSRSRRTAEEMLKDQPDALIDVHRDGIPDPSEYEIELDGEDASKVRLLVGRSNPNSQSNREFAKEIKAVADELYPGLVKDIFVGKGNYNQELFPQAILLEFGTHTTAKDEVLESTGFMADVLQKMLGSETASAESNGEKQATGAKSGGFGIVWVLLAAVVAIIAYGLLSTGSFKGMVDKAGRGVSEVTGGLMGKKRDKK